MAEGKRYKVIVSDRARFTLGAHMKFLSQVSKTAASAEKREILAELRLLSQMPQRSNAIRLYIILLLLIHKKSLAA